MSDSSRGWLYRLFDYVGFACLLAAVEEFIRNRGLWHVWVGALLAGIVFLCVGDIGPQVKTLVLGWFGRLESRQALKDARAEIADLKSQLALRPTHQDQVKLQNEIGDLKNRLDSIPTRRWPHGNVFTVQSVKAEHDPNATYKDKIRVVLTNTVGRDLHVWLPVWESTDVFPQYPFGARFRLEGSAGWRNRDWTKEANGNEVEYSCLEVRAGHTCDCFIGLLPPPGRSIEERLRTGTAVGTATFPVTIEGKLYDVAIDL